MVRHSTRYALLCSERRAYFFYRPRWATKVGVVSREVRFQGDEDAKRLIASFLVQSVLDMEECGDLATDVDAITGSCFVSEALWGARWHARLTR